VSRGRVVRAFVLLLLGALRDQWGGGSAHVDWEGLGVFIAVKAPDSSRSMGQARAPSDEVWLLTQA
jgi:hypothetical protein